MATVCVARHRASRWIFMRLRDGGVAADRPARWKLGYVRTHLVPVSHASKGWKESETIGDSAAAAAAVTGTWRECVHLMTEQRCSRAGGCKVLRIDKAAAEWLAHRQPIGRATAMRTADVKLAIMMVVRQHAGVATRDGNVMQSIVRIVL